MYITKTEAVYHEFATQENLFSCAEFMNDKIIKHEVRQACNAWILELSHHAFRYKLTNVFLQNLSFCFAKKFVHSSGKATVGFAVACFSF